MNCKRAQFDIALMAGGDLDASTELELLEHLAACRQCHAHWMQMQHALPALLERDDHPREVDALHDSVWPELQVRLPRPAPLSQRSHFNGWVVGLAVCGVCLAMVSLWNTAQRSSELSDALDGGGLADSQLPAATPLQPLPPPPGAFQPGGDPAGLTPVIRSTRRAWPPWLEPFDAADPPAGERSDVPRFPQGTRIYVRFPRHD